jgi:RNA recognition motif-containing protein
MNTELLVKNLALDVTRETLRTAFAVHGCVFNVDLARNRITARSKGFAVVTMGTEQEARNAMAALNGSLNNGRMITVLEAGRGETSRERHPPRREFRKLY